MKNIFITILTFLSLILNGQNNMNEQLSKLFLDLDLTSDPKTMVSKSPLKFEYGINRTINWGHTNNSSGNYVANFDRNPLIGSEIKNGVLTVIAGELNAQRSSVTINERIWFHSYEDMFNEYTHICSSFEKFGYRVKTTIVENDNFQAKSAYTEILMKSNSEISTLTIGYILPPEDEKDKEYMLALVYNNK